MKMEAIPTPDLADVSQKLQDYLYRVALLLNVNFGTNSGTAGNEQEEERSTAVALEDLKTKIAELEKEMNFVLKYHTQFINMIAKEVSRLQTRVIRLEGFHGIQGD